MSEQLNEALKIQNEKEMLIMKIEFFENELKCLKARLDEIA